MYQMFHKKHTDVIKTSTSTIIVQLLYNFYYFIFMSWV